MNENFYATAAVPLVVGLVQALKQASPKLMSAWAFLIAVALGIAVGFLIQFGVPDVQGSVANAVFGGIAIGLSAAGLYSGGTAMIDFFQQPSKPTQAPTYPTTIKGASLGGGISPDKAPNTMKAVAGYGPPGSWPEGQPIPMLTKAPIPNLRPSTPYAYPKIGDHIAIDGEDYTLGISDTVSSPFPTPPAPPSTQLPPSMLPPATDTPKETPPPSPFITPVPTDKPADSPPTRAI